jgi:hypothetical protein
VSRRREDDTRAALATLEPSAVASAQEPAAAWDAFNLAFLVERERHEDFDHAVAHLRDQLGERIDLRYVGPLPPYSFVDIDLRREDAAWA